MDPDTSTKPRQTPAQWAVRWHGVVLAALLVCSVPAIHLGWHVVLGREAPPLETRSQTPWPAASWPRIADATWMAELERHLREASPVVWLLRGSFNEAMLRLGVEQSPRVALGRDGWMFQQPTLRPDTRRLARQAPERRRVFRELRDLVRGAGAELVVALVPDKAHVYPDYAYPDGVLDAGKATVLDVVRAELRDLGIPAPDLLPALVAARLASGDEPVYYRRDTHWRPHGALAAMQALAGGIEALPIAAALPPRREAELGGRAFGRALGDIATMLGLLTVERPTSDGRSPTRPLSLLSWDLTEEREHYSVLLHDGAARIPALVDDPACAVLHIGTSFAEENGTGALALALGRQVRLVSALGAGGVGGIAKVRVELRAGTQARLVIWEIVERGLLEVDWATVRL